MNRLLKKIFEIWFGGRAFFKKIVTQSETAANALFLKGAKTQLPFLIGTNLPWLNYGGDFGANAWNPEGGTGKPARREELRQIFRKLHERGTGTVRWFLLCDGRAGIRFSAAGTPIGPDPYLFTDIDAALEIAAECHMQVIFVLLDFLWLGKVARVSDVQVRGRGNVFRGAYKQGALRRRVLKPLFRRYGRSPVILAWDIINEPEWATRGYGGDSGSTLPYLAMRRFIKRTARMVHRYTSQLATVGLANAAGLPLVRDAGLDFYQVHWYDRWDAVAPLDKPVAEWNLDRPLLLGEYPTKNSTRQPDAIVALAEKSGYCGAFGWSVLGTDRCSGIDLEREHG